MSQRTANAKTLVHAVLLCLPAAAVVGAVVYFLFDKVPEIVRNEHRRVVAEYRVIAEDLKNGELPSGDVFAETVKRQKTARKMKPGRWDFEPDGELVRVWYAEGDSSRAVRVPAIDEVDYGTAISVASALFVVFFVGITVLGVRYFWMFARERDDFLAATAHDLATPLVGMRYAIGRSDEDARLLNERMIRIVENIKDFMKLGGRRVPAIGRVDVLGLCREAYAVFRDDYRDLFGGGDVPIVAADGGECAIEAEADPTMLVQILWNLFGNDLKYAAPYGRVEVRLSREDGFVLVEFIDEGQGMGKAQMRKAFDRYYRARTVLQTGKGGFGIGLCTAREFAVAMGGSLSVRANSPKGCIFTLRLRSGASVRPDAAPAS